MLKGIVLVTGVKVREASHIFPHQTASKLIEHEGRTYKLNTAAGVAVALNAAGYFVVMVGFVEADLSFVATQMATCHFSYEVAHPLRQLEVARAVASASVLKDTLRIPLHIVHYGGASTTEEPLPNDTVFLDFVEIPLEAPAALIKDNCESFLRLYHEARPLLLDQPVSKVISITSIASTRGKTGFALDALQKGAMHQLLRCLALEETPHHIYVTEIMPGITDTGYYDNKVTLERSLVQAKQLGYDWKEDDFPLFTPEHVGLMVAHALDFPGHVREITAVPYGQYPHLGA